MVDNTTLNAGVGGDVIASDDIGGVKHQRVKVGFGADGSYSDAALTNPVPVISPDVTAAGNIVALSGVVTLPLLGRGAVAIQVSNTWTGALTFQGSADGGVTYNPINATAATTSTPQSTTTVNALFRLTGGGLTHIQVIATAAMTGTAAVTINAALGGSGTFLNQVATVALGTTDAANLAGINTKTPAVGQVVSAASSPVVIASDQSALPVQIADITASGNITTQNLVPAGVATANSAVEIVLAGRAQVAVQTEGTFTGALSAQVQVSSGAWVTLGGLQIYNALTGGGQATIASASQGVFTIATSGFQRLRITGLAAMTGAATVTLRASNNVSTQAVISPIPTGANNIGNVNVSSVTSAGPSAPSATVGGFTTFSTIVAAAGTNATLIKASGGTIGLIYAHNNTASVKYVKVFNKATAPVPGTDTPIMNLAIPANNFFEINVAPGMRTAAGIGIAITGGQALLDSTAVVAGDITLNISYI